MMPFIHNHNKSNIFLGFALILFVLFLAGCMPNQNVKTPSEDENITEDIAPEVSDTVQNILDNPTVFEGRNVEIVGYYRGWDLLDEVDSPSPVSRSDWVINDNTGAIYATPDGEWTVQLDPGSMDDTTKKIRLTGTVRLTNEGQPYIQTSLVEGIETVQNIVQNILDNPTEFEGRIVEIVGYYRGWDLLNEVDSPSPVSRSDWVINDNTGAIYATPDGEWTVQLDPGSMDDTTKKIRLTGTVRLTNEGQPYIQTSLVEGLE